MIPGTERDSLYRYKFPVGARAPSLKSFVTELKFLLQKTIESYWIVNLVMKMSLYLSWIALIYLKVKESFGILKQLFSYDSS